jgi:hypothetical protein
MARIPFAVLMFALIRFGLSACDYVVPSRGISAAIDAAMRSGPTATTGFDAADCVRGRRTASRRINGTLS